ncbi:MAG: hypothetical protein IJ570_02600 [Prevotella sp.]|nr:hypothetical protein [Prevotella sp.]
MKKTLLLLAAFVLSLSAAQAQQFNVLKAERGVLQSAPVASTNIQNKAPKKIELADNQIVLGGYATDAYSTSAEGLGVGSYATGTLRVAMELPIEDFAAFDGGKVLKIRLALANATSVSRVFITPIANGLTGADLVSQNVSINTAGWSEVELTTPLELDFSQYEELLLGFDYNQRSNNYPLSIIEEGETFYNSLVYGNLGQGTGWYNLGSSYGNLSVQAIVEGDFVGNSAKPKDLGNIIIPFGASTTKNLTVVNTNKGKVQSVDYVLTIDGEAQPEQHATLNGIPFGETGTVEVTFPSADEEKTQSYSITITKVNDETNNEQNNTVSGLMVSTTKSFVQRVVVEEFTGTGCGWCPRGLVGMEMLREAYGDLFVGIGVHQHNSSDAMYIATNAYAKLGFSGAPSCALQRKGIIDPYYGSTNNNFHIAQDFEAISSQTAFAGVELEAQWNEDSTKVEARASVESLFDGANYNLEFVLIGDSLSGTGSAWNQSNYYYQYTAADVESEDLAPWCKGGKYGRSSVSGFKFNDVALSSSYVSGTNQVPAIENISSTEPVIREYTLSLPSKTTLKNAIKPNLLFVAALLIDPTDGSIANAIKVPVTEYIDPTTTSITNATSSNEEVVRYSLDGRQLSAPQKGLNIIRMANGETRKVIIR